MNVYYGFRPLPGTYISQWKLKSIAITEYWEFPSPTGDLYFSMLTTIFPPVRPSCFRPLPGTYISQYY